MSQEGEQPDSTSAPTSLTDNTWRGGFYELALELGPSDDDRLLAVHRFVWADPNLRVRWRRFTGGIGLAPAPEYAPDSIADADSYRGEVRLPSGRWCPCLTFHVREEESRRDWFGLGLPLGALEECGEPVGAFPFDDSERAARRSERWRRPLDSWLAGLGQRIFAAVPFSLGFIGFEVSALESSRDPSLDQSPERFIGYLIPNRHGSVDYLPPNRYGGYHLA